MHPPRVTRKRTYEELFGVNPRRRRNPATRSALSAAAGALANPRRRNPGLSSLVGEIAKDVVKGGLIAAAQEEAKEWRGRIHQGGLGYAVRAEVEEQRRKKPRKNPPKRRRARKNPATLVAGHPDPKLREMSRRFHGRDDQIVRLGDDQRRSPPKYAVLVGREEAIAYRPPRGSQRSGAVWEHSAGDRGGGNPRQSGRRLVVADDRGRTYVVPGTSRMRWDPDRGLVG